MREDTGTFHARSNKQTMVTLSSTEAETYGAVEATKDIVYVRGLLAEWDSHRWNLLLST